MKKIILYSLAMIVTLIVALVIVVNLTWKVDHTPNYPVNVIKIDADSSMIANGKHLVYGPAHCSHCHVPISQLSRVDAGEILPLIGGFEFTMPFGTIRSPNITMDKETGIGNLTDGEIYRMLRHNVKHDGLVTIELMPFKDMSEYDVKSIIAYLRTTEAVHHEVEENDLNFLGKAIFKFAIKPSQPEPNIPVSIKRDSSILYGKYLAASVANCRGCHTARDLSTGEFIGPEYAGGMSFEPSPETGGWHFITPSLTDPERNPVMSNEKDFIARFRAGRLIATSPMPWGSFNQMSDSDLKAIYRYLKTIEKADYPEAGKIVPPQATAEL